MSKPLCYLPYGKQNIDRSDIRAVLRVLKSNYLTQGPEVGRFETCFAKTVGAKYAIAVSNGTAALHLVALAIGLKRGDEVLNSPISFVATSNSAFYAGAKPVFLDIDPVHGCLNAGLLHKRLTRKTKAIFVTHFAGHPADMSEIRIFARKHNLWVVEDAAHALGAEYKKNAIGNAAFSDAVIFSFHPVKHITTGEGGMITTNDENLYKRLLKLRTHGITKDPAEMKKNPGPWFYEMQTLGFNYRLTDIQAALGTAQLARLDKFVAQRRFIAGLYNKKLRDVDGIVLPQEKKDVKSSYHLYFIRFKDKKLRDCKAEIMREFHSNGIGVQVHYIPIPSQPYYRKMGYTMSGMLEAQCFYEEALSLPVFSAMKAADVSRVVKVLKQIVFKIRNQ